MKQNISIFWIIWSAIFMSLFVYPFVLPTVKPEEGSVDILFIAMLIGPIAFSVVVRWVIIPKTKTIQSIFTFFIIGIAVAESLVFFGLFMFPYFQGVMFTASVLAVFQFIPLFLKIEENPKQSYWELETRNR